MNASLHRNAASQSSTHHEPFSRATHFALILSPVMAGVAYSLARDGGDSALMRLGVFALFMFGLGTALKLLAGISEVHDQEHRR